MTEKTVEYFSQWQKGQSSWNPVDLSGYPTEQGAQDQIDGIRIRGAPHWKDCRFRIVKRTTTETVIKEQP